VNAKTLNRATPGQNNRVTLPVSRKRRLMA